MKIKVRKEFSVIFLCDEILSKITSIRQAKKTQEDFRNNDEVKLARFLFIFIPLNAPWFG